MRGLLGKLGLRSAMVLGIAVVVLAVVGIARLNSHGDGATPYHPDSPVTNTADPTAGDDGVAVVPSSFPDDAMIIAAAEAFAKAWLSRSLTAREWQAALTPLVTAGLIESLQGVDPATVPATRVLAPPTIELRTESNARTSTTVDTGTLVLGLNKQQDHWLVESIDWDRA